MLYNGIALGHAELAQSALYSKATQPVAPSLQHRLVGCQSCLPDFLIENGHEE